MTSIEKLTPMQPLTKLDKLQEPKLIRVVNHREKKLPLIYKIEMKLERAQEPKPGEVPFMERNGLIQRILLKLANQNTGHPNTTNNF